MLRNMETEREKLDGLQKSKKYVRAAVVVLMAQTRKGHPLRQDGNRKPRPETALELQEYPFGCASLYIESFTN